MTSATTAIAEQKQLVFFNGQTIACQRATQAYFNIPDDPPNAETGMTLVTRDLTTPRARYHTIADDAPIAGPVAPPAGGTANEGLTQRFARAKNLSGTRGRRPRSNRIRVPTEKRTPKGTIRTVFFQFTVAYIDAQISNWLFDKCAAHKPLYFYNKLGSRIAVVNQPASIADLNPGQNEPGATVGTA